MLPYLTEHFGNPSGAHAVSRRARLAVEDARDLMAAHLGTEPGRVVFTAGGTESCNLAVLGVWRRRGGAVMCSAVEHPAVLRPAQSTGTATLVPVDRRGLVDLDALADRLHPGVALISVMLANNETGVIQPLDRVAELVRDQAPGALLHTDAVGAGAWLDLSAACRTADLVSLGAHKFGGPKGVGALVVGPEVDLEPVQYGGPQERERRAGTHDVAGIVGMAAALDTALGAVAGARARGDAGPGSGPGSGPGNWDEGPRVRRLRDRLADGLLGIPGVTETVPSGDSEVLPGTCHVLVEGVDQQELLVLLDQDGVCASAGSACASGALEASHVLLAMGLSESQAVGAVRFSLGWSSTPVDVEEAVPVVAKAVARLRA